MIRIVFIVLLIVFLFVPIYLIVKKIRMAYRIEIETEGEKDEIEELKMRKKVIAAELKNKTKELAERQKINEKLKKEIM